MKKVLSVLIAVAMLAAVCSIGVNAASYPIYGTYDGPSGSYYGAYCSDYSMGLVFGNAYTGNSSCTNGAEIGNYTYHGSWIDVGRTVGDMADAYSPNLMYTSAYYSKDEWTAYHWSNMGRR